MKFKKAMAFALTGALTAGAVCSGAFAESTTVKLTVDTTVDYVLTIPATLEVANKGWNEIADGIKADNTDNKFKSTKKVVVTASSDNSWQLKADGVASGISYELKGAESDNNSNDSAVWEFGAEELNTEGGTTKTAGVNVSDYDDADPGEYEDTITFSASVAAVQ